MNENSKGSASPSVSYRVSPGRQARQRYGSILGSLQGRITVFAVSSCIALIFGAMLVFILMRQASVPVIENLKARQFTQADLGSLRFYIERSESALLRYLIAPEPKVKKEIFGLLDSYKTGLQRLRRSEWVRSSPKFAGRLSDLGADQTILRDQISALLDIRDNNTKLFPSMPVMLNDMLPANDRFYTAATLSMLALDEEANAGNAPARKQFRVFADVRHSWSRMIGAFRLYVTNRLGIFGDPVKGMESRLTNIEIYRQQVDGMLTQLRAWRDSAQLSLEAESALQDMISAKDEWLAGFQVVVDKFNNEDWRMDLTAFRSKVNPEFQHISKDLEILATQLEASTVKDINALTTTGERVAQYLMIFALLGVVVSIVFYLVFRRSVLLPINQVASALRNEADAATDKGQELAPLPTLPVATTKETHDLVSAFMDMREQVWIRQLRLATILDNTAEGIITFDADGKIQTFNDAAQKLFQCSEQEAIGNRIEDLIPPQHISIAGEKPKAINGCALYMELSGREAEAIARKRNGDIMDVSLKLTTMTIRDQQIFTGLVEDISDRKALLDHLRHLAERDALTGLFNRTEFERNLKRVLKTAQLNGPESTLLYMDLDQFKVLNDTCGHVAGDESLRKLAAILQEQVRTGDMLARLGGDEFAVLLENCPLTKGLEIAEKIRETVSEQRFAWEAASGNLSVSIGVVPINASSKNMVEVLNAADRACYAAKDGGRNRVYVYRDTDTDLVRRRSEMIWVSRIKSAMEDGHFFLVAQPIAAVAEHNAAAGFWELLLRMRDEDGRVVEPGAYLPAAERFDLLISLDKWVVTTVLDWLAQIKDQLRGDELFGVNLSGQSVGSCEFAEYLISQLGRTGVNARNLCFEITETAAVTHFQQAWKFMNALKEKGAYFALDDFGSGLSSFGILKNLKVDYLKIDGSFVKDIAVDPIDLQMVRSINDIGHLMGMQTIAEWVESDAVIAHLRALGVDWMQGTVIGKPVDLDKLGFEPSGVSAEMA